MKTGARKATTLFIIDLVYKCGLDEIDAHMPEHVAYLKKYYARGHFLMSGRKVPRDGGIILARAASRSEIENIAREDPFSARGLADLRIVEFRVSQRADELEAFRSRG